MADTVAGIALPDGNPDLASAIAQELAAVSGGFSAAAQTSQRAIASVPGWQGLASFAFHDTCMGYAGAAGQADDACQQAAAAVRSYAQRLTDAIERIKGWQRQGEDCVDTIARLDARASAARERESAARAQATSAMLTAPLDGGTSIAQQAAATSTAEQAAGEANAAEQQAQAQRDELTRLQGLADDEREAVKNAGRHAADRVDAAGDALPAVQYPPGPAVSGTVGVHRSPLDTIISTAGRVASMGQVNVGDVTDPVGAVTGRADTAKAAAVFGAKQAAQVPKGVEGSLSAYVQLAQQLRGNQRAYGGTLPDLGPGLRRTVVDSTEYAIKHPREAFEAIANTDKLRQGHYGEWLGSLSVDVAAGAAAGKAGAASARLSAAAKLDRVSADAAAAEGFHYTRSAAVRSIERRGLDANSYATTDGDLSPLQAHIDLALPPNRGLPDAVIRVDLRGMREAGYDIPDFTIVGRTFNMPGGGSEIQFEKPVPPEFLRVIRR